LLTEELVARGHDVTLFAGADSNTSAKLEPMWDLAICLDGSVKDPNALLVTLEKVRQRISEFDFCIFAVLAKRRYTLSLFHRRRRNCEAGEDVGDFD
jgi:hypothetical protein